ncbi:hypothetical protein ACGFIF_39510 [Kribbella sp. NPDC049174]|uniref:hypothetical protein n=1 Tax=Kribbella sp. NPDC049174 TaxID=3364112 RepID=UPI003714C977
MTTAIRRTAGRVAVAGLATLALAGAAIAGGQAAQVSTGCENSALGKTFDVVLSFRDGLSSDTAHACMRRQ